MKQSKWTPPRTILVIALAAAMVGGLAAISRADKADKPAKKERTGAELYAMNCARCHAERYPTERTDAQWKTIMLHMRVRAQIPASDAKKTLEYLKENN